MTSTPSEVRRDILAELSERMGAMSEGERETLRRHLTGVAEHDLIKRGEAEKAIREGVSASLSLPPEARHAVQRALFAAIRRVGSVKAEFEA